MTDTQTDTHTHTGKFIFFIFIDSKQDRHIHVFVYLTLLRSWLFLGAADSVAAFRSSPRLPVGGVTVLSQERAVVGQLFIAVAMFLLNIGNNNC